MVFVHEGPGDDHEGRKGVLMLSQLAFQDDRAQPSQPDPLFRAGSARHQKEAEPVREVLELELGRPDEPVAGHLAFRADQQHGPRVTHTADPAAKYV